MNPRPPWPIDFPDVAVHTTVARRDAHAAYAAAKSGNGDAAEQLARDLLDAVVLEALRRQHAGHDVVILPVTALESGGMNMIPIAFAGVLGMALNRTILRGVLQANLVGHTRASGFHRLAFPARFTGPVPAGHGYLIVDDHVGLGGTIAALRGHVMAQGGSVVGATTLTQSRDSHRLALTETTLSRLRRKHGDALEQYWREKFRYGLDGLTEPEAGYPLRAATLDSIRAGIAQAEARGNAGQDRPEETSGGMSQT